MRSEKAFGGQPACDLDMACPCKNCEVRRLACRSACESFKKYAFVRRILLLRQQAIKKEAAASREMRNDRIWQWRQHRCWPKG